MVSVPIFFVDVVVVIIFAISYGIDISIYTFVASIILSLPIA
jgi:hypothetical protein